MGESYNKNKIEHEKLRTLINEVQKTISKNEEILENGSESLAKLTKEIKAKEDEIKENHEFIKKATDYLKEIEEKAMEIMGQIDQNEELLEFNPRMDIRNRSKMDIFEFLDYQLIQQRKKINRELSRMEKKKYAEIIGLFLFVMDLSIEFAVSVILL